MKNFSLFCEIFKFGEDDDKRFAGGVVYEPEKVDSQGDSASAEEIQKACHGFMEDLAEGRVGAWLMHKEAAGPRIKIVECAIAHDAFRMGNQQIPKGSWYMVMKIYDDEIWKLVKSGRLSGFSMGGRAESE